MFQKKWLIFVILIFIAGTGRLNANSLLDWFQPACATEENYWINLDLLYWKPWEKSLVLTNKKSPVFFTDNFTKAKVIHPHFNWDLGFRLGAGYATPCCLWNVSLNWTHYHTSAHQHRSTNSNDITNVNNQQGMFPIWALSKDILAGDYVSAAKLDWRLHLNLIDLDFGYPLSCLNCFEIRPYVGIRTAIINQNAHIGYSGGIFFIDIIQAGISLNGTDHVHLRNDFWGIGPRFGISPQYSLGNGFCLYGDAAISGLCGVFDVNQKECFLGSKRFHHHKHLVRVRGIADLAAGISWDTCFCQGRYSVAFKLGWEYHIFFHQLELKGDDFHLVSHNRDLDVQGVTFSSQFAF